MTEEAYLSEISHTLKNFYQTNELYTNNTAVNTELTYMKLDDVIKLNYILIFMIATFYLVEYIYKLLGGKK